MRYYRILVEKPKGGGTFRDYTSFVAGKSIPGALNVELDVPVIPFATPMGAAAVTIWGIPLSDISQASDFNGMTVSIYGGFQKGFPLADPAQAGLLAKGMIFQAFGNWIDTEQTLNFNVQPSVGSPDDPKNIVLDWAKGTKLSDAIQSTLSTAFPDFKTDIKISDKLVLPADEKGYFQSLVQFAQYARTVSAAIVGGDYTGVDIVLTESTLKVYDGTTQTSPTLLAFRDMIGQPTWIDPLTVQAKFAMRADLNVGDFIKFPPAIVTNTAAGAATTGSNLKQTATFQGVFMIKLVRHVGNFRQPDGASWVTVVNAASTAPVTG